MASSNATFNGTANSTDSNKYADLYLYDPSRAAAVIFVVLFAITSFLHVFQMLRSRTWYLIPLTVGGFFEWIGYASRAYQTTQNPNYTLGPYIVQVLLPLVAPALFAASIYMMLGRIILLVNGERHSIVRRTWLTKIFVLGDVFTFTVQSGGGGLQASKDPDTIHTGQLIVLGGLIIQIISFGFFVLVAILFHYRMRKAPTTKSMQEPLPWAKHLHALYISSVLIMVRSIFRVVEFVQGRTGYTQRHEWGLYVFDAVLMLGVLILFNLVHPGEIKRLLNRKTDAADGEAELVESTRKQ